MYVIEFQKRGLPHAHILLILEDEFKPKTVDDINRIICAEIPHVSKSNNCRNTAIQHMMHGPYGPLSINSPCMGNALNSIQNNMLKVKKRMLMDIPCIGDEK